MSRNWSVPISLIALFVSICSFTSSIVVPQIQKNSRLISFRNLACYSTRVATNAVAKIKTQNEWSNIDEHVMDVILVGLTKVDLADLPDPRLTEQFLDILHYTEIMSDMKKEKIDPTIPKNNEDINNMQEIMTKDLLEINTYVDRSFWSKFTSKAPPNGCEYN